MIKKIFFALFLSMSIFSSCEYDYDIDKYFDKEYIPQVVLNSVITPDSVMDGHLFWTKHIDSDDDFKTIDTFYVKLYEENVIIFESQCSNGKFNSAIYPKVGLNYRIEVDIPNYGLVKASTNIPSPAKSIIAYIETRGDSSFWGYDHYRVDSITTSQKSRSIWIKGLYDYSDKTYNDNLRELYINNPFCDQVNAVGDDSDVQYRGSNIGHEYFIRVPYKDITKSLSLNFSISQPYDKRDNVLVGEDSFGYPIYENKTVATVEGTELLLITPSDDYDKYYKTLYLQKGVIQMPIFQDIILVHSNIENGVGIFAGFSATKHYFTIPVK